MIFLTRLSAWPTRVRCYSARAYLTVREKNDDFDGVGKTVKLIHTFRMYMTVLNVLKTWCSVMSLLKKGLKTSDRSALRTFLTIATKTVVHAFRGYDLVAESRESRQDQSRIFCFSFFRLRARRKPSWRVKRVYFENAICDIPTCALFTTCTHTHTHIIRRCKQSLLVMRACPSRTRHEFNTVVYFVQYFNDNHYNNNVIVVGKSSYTSYLFKRDYLTRKKIFRNNCTQLLLYTVVRVKNALRRRERAYYTIRQFKLCASPILCCATTLFVVNTMFADELTSTCAIT